MNKFIPFSASLSLSSFAFPFTTKKYTVDQILSYNSNPKKEMSHKSLLRNTIGFFFSLECWKGNVLLVLTTLASCSSKIWVGHWAKIFSKARQIPAALIKNQRDLLQHSWGFTMWLLFYEKRRCLECYDSFVS